jgi:hypothetical protein
VGLPGSAQKAGAASARFQHSKDSIKISSSALSNGDITHLNPEIRGSLNVHTNDDAAMKSGGVLDGLSLWNSIGLKAVLSGPDWEPSEPLPLNVTEAEKIARAELRRLVRDEPSWFVYEIALWRQHVKNGPSNKWHYTIGFFPLDGSSFDMLTVNVALSGEAGETSLREQE